MNVILFDGPLRQNLLPLTYTRPVGKLRVGIFTINEKWEQVMKTTVSYLTQKYLSPKFLRKIGNDNLLISGGLIPDGKVEKACHSLHINEGLYVEDKLIAARLTGDKVVQFESGDTDFLSRKEYADEVILIENSWDIFQKNGKCISLDFKKIASKKDSQELSESNMVIGDESHIFVEEGAHIEGAILNASTGPIYIGKNATIMEGSLIRGPFVLGDHSEVKMGAKIYGPTTVGPHCKVGGEISNSVFFQYSNKGHDGFMGNSVIGEWCNIGADTNTSNLKNNYAKVKLWSYATERFVDTGLQFCGLIMGDHSKCGINTMFNTGTVVGVSANVYGAGFPRNFIPSFAWGGSGGMVEFKYEKAAEVAVAMMKRREIAFDENEQQILKWVFTHTANFRNNLK